MSETRDTLTKAEDTLTKAEKKLLKQLAKTQKSVFSRFPLLFTLLGAFGVTATFAGLSGIIERIDFLGNNPIVLFVCGLLILALTGKLYQKLG